MDCIHIYYGDMPAVLHGRLVTIQNYHVLESSIDPYSDLDQLKSHIVDLLGVNLNSYQVHLEGVRPRVVPNTSAPIYIPSSMIRGLPRNLMGCVFKTSRASSTRFGRS